MSADATSPMGARSRAEDDGKPSAALGRQGLLRLQAGAFEEAIGLLSRASTLDPDDPRTRLHLGVALQGARRHAEALEHFAAARRALADDPAPSLHAALSLLALGKAEAALGAAGEACALAPQLPQALCAQGQALLALGRPEPAEQAFATALRSAPTSADAWVLVGVARYRQGAIEAASAAMRQALHHAPGHAAASANLAALQQAVEQRAAVPARPDDRAGPGAGRQAPREGAVLRVWRPQDAAAALGLAVDYLSRKPAFAKLQFGEWTQTLRYQVARGHYLFVADADGRIQGFLGWALTRQPLAELWLEGRAGLRNEECREGDCVILNAWAADTPQARRFILDAGRELFADRRAIYFKRRYPDGRTRPMRLAVNDLVARHRARAAAGHRVAPDEADVR